MTFWQRLHTIITHPRTSVLALVTGISGVAAALASVDSSLVQLSQIHGLPPHFIGNVQDASVKLGAVVSVSMLLASTGSSWLKALPATPTSPTDGGNIVIPFVQAVTTVSTVPPPMPDSNQSSSPLKKAA